MERPQLPCRGSTKVNAATATLGSDFAGSGFLTHRERSSTVSFVVIGENAGKEISTSAKTNSSKKDIVAGAG
jgi:hypothetical protein